MILSRASVFPAAPTQRIMPYKMAQPIPAMRLVSTRVNERMSALPLTGEPRHDFQLAVAELLPLDDVRLAEAEIWLAFAGKSLSDPDIRRISQQVHSELYEGFRRMIDWLAARGDVREGLDLRAEARRLHAFVDGLALHIVTAADKPDPDDARKLVSFHLDSLFAR